MPPATAVVLKLVEVNSSGSCTTQFSISSLGSPHSCEPGGCAPARGAVSTIPRAGSDHAAPRTKVRREMALFGMSVTSDPFFRDALTPQCRNYPLSELGDRFRCSEIGEPHIEALCAVVAQAGEVGDQFVGAAADQPGSQLTEPAAGRADHRLGVSTVADETDHLLHRGPRRTDLAHQLRQFVDVGGR